jgi:hypothetical protein
VWLLLYVWDLDWVRRMHIRKHIMVQVLVRALVSGCAMFDGVCNDGPVNIQEDDIIGSWVESKHREECV